MFIEDPALAEFEDVRHGFFSRRGGVGRGIYDSLNCSFSSGDEPGTIRENRHRVAAAMDVLPENLVTLNQIHSDICVTVTEPWPYDRQPEADALVTNIPGIALGVLTADCAPILFAGKDREGRPVIGAAHAGWRGALDGVIASTVAAMRQLGADPAGITAGVGPCLGFESYEVDEEFRAAFIEKAAENTAFFREDGLKKRYHFGFPSFVVKQLNREGIGRIREKAIDTYFNEEDYFSFRRSQHRKEPDYGRQVSAIAITVGKER